MINIRLIAGGDPDESLARAGVEALHCAAGLGRDEFTVNKMFVRQARDAPCRERFFCQGCPFSAHASSSLI